ncbi:hypothetical protein GR925_33600 [Streptomyces sp. HUCO-GS316]|uniref:hypothetical protein n=1 Tax=Streptomyces sp. HUCO-GS316 TaxID=2692198 RepID=UPI00136957FF|nr:hypothetical protein [Streptomyces sp. HUCO-GS316]MXM68245.1 hypothetical protein [Streptomyces sp. HUCO-GS316]
MSDASEVEELTALLDATGLGALMASLATLLLALVSATMERLTAPLAPSSPTAHWPVGVGNLALYHLAAALGRRPVDRLPRMRLKRAPILRQAQPHRLQTAVPLDEQALTVLDVQRRQRPLDRRSPMAVSKASSASGQSFRSMALRPHSRAAVSRMDVEACAESAASRKTAAAGVPLANRADPWLTRIATLAGWSGPMIARAFW